MNSIFKLKESTLSEIAADMTQPHPFAWERVGCLFTRCASADKSPPIIIATRYWPLADYHYLRDDSVGARISSGGIQAMMQEILDTKEGAFLVHKHPHRGIPSLSATDRQQLLPLVGSFRNVEPRAVHGAFLLSENCIAGWVLLPNQDHFTTIRKITVVGFPVSFFNLR
jgi:hypothetical protein